MQSSRGGFECSQVPYRFIIFLHQTCSHQTGKIVIQLDNSANQPMTTHIVTPIPENLWSLLIILSPFLLNIFSINLQFLCKRYSRKIVAIQFSARVIHVGQQQFLKITRLDSTPFQEKSEDEQTCIAKWQILKKKKYLSINREEMASQLSITPP